MVPGTAEEAVMAVVSTKVNPQHDFGVSSAMVTAEAAALAVAEVCTVALVAWQHPSWQLRSLHRW